MDRSPPEASDNSRINETADDFNDLTPLLGSDAEPDEVHAIDETPDEQASSNVQGPPEGSCVASTEQSPPSDAKLEPAQTTDDFKERTPLLRDGAASKERKHLRLVSLRIFSRISTSDEQASLKRTEAASDEQQPPDKSCAVSSEPTPPSDVKLHSAQAAPSQKYEDLVIDDELYALGGAVGGTEIDVECSSADMDAIRRSTAELDAIYGSTGEMGAKRRSTGEMDAKRRSTGEMDAKRRSTGEMDAKRHSEIELYSICGTKEMEAIFGAIAKCLSTGEMDAINRLKEEMDAIRLSKEEMDAVRLSKEERDAVRLSKEERDAVRLSKEERDAVRLSKEERDAVRLSKEERDVIHRIKEEMDALKSSTADATGRRRSRGEMVAILRSKEEMGAKRLLKKEMDAIRHTAAETDTTGHSTAEKTVACGSTAAVRDAVGDSIKSEIDNSGGADKVSSEVQADFDNIVKVLFLSWLHSPPKRSRETHEYEFFTPKALESLTTTWKLLKTKIDVLPEPEIVVKGLTEIIVQHFYLKNLKLPEDVLAALRRTMTTRVTELVEEGWQKVLDGIEKEEQERERKRRERRRKFRERMRRAEEVAEVLRFYAPIAQLDNNPPITCQRFSAAICGYFSLFIYQIPISILLLAWPLSIGIMGGLHMTQCPMSPLMPYVMIALGIVGTVALLLRLSYAIYEAFAFYAIHTWLPGNVLKFIEFIFLDCLIVHLMYFFSDTPDFVPGTSKYCNETFYNFVSWMNWVSIALVCYWIFVYVTRAVLWLRRRNFDYSYRRY